MKSEMVSPVSFPVNVLRLPQNGMPVVITATPEQRVELAQAHGLLSVERLHAELLVETWKRKGIRVTGFVEGRIEQACIVTLESMDTRIREEIDALFVPEDSKLVRPAADQRGEILLDAEGADSPEVFSGDMIDVGALAEEFFALGIDPYPRKPDAVLEQPGGKDPEESPFAKLQSLKRES